MSVDTFKNRRNFLKLSAALVGTAALLKIPIVRGLTKGEPILANVVEWIEDVESAKQFNKVEESWKLSANFGVNGLQYKKPIACKLTKDFQSPNLYLSTPDLSYTYSPIILKPDETEESFSALDVNGNKVNNSLDFNIISNAAGKFSDAQQTRILLQGTIEIPHNGDKLVLNDLKSEEIKNGSLVTITPFKILTFSTPPESLERNISIPKEKIVYSVEVTYFDGVKKYFRAFTYDNPNKGNT